MTSALHAQVIALIIGLLFLVGFQGCAHTPPPSSLPESIQQQLGKIGVVVKSTGERKNLEIPRTGRLSTIGNIGRGAALGASLGIYGAICGPGIVVCGPLLAVPGAIVMAIAGAKSSESGPLQKEAESAFEAALTDMALEEVILNDTIAYSRENGYDIDKLPTGAQCTEQDQTSDPASPPATVGAILEIRDPILIVAPTGFFIAPRRLILSAQIRLIRTVDDTVLDDRIVTDEFGTTRSLAEWTTDNAKVFREEVSLAAHRLAITFSEQEFMLHRFPERKFSMNTNYNGYFTGLEPQYPPMVVYPSFNQADIVPKISSLQPTLQWEAFTGDDVTYDLMIWRAAGPNLGNLVYNRERLTEPLHTIEIQLDPKTRYFWTVRARFSANGRTKLTEWSTRSVSAGLLSKVFSLGLASLVGHPDDSTSGFYQFRTF